MKDRLDPFKGPKKEHDRVHRAIVALGHPIRRQVLAILSRQRASAGAIADELGLPINSISYHLIQVLDRDCGAVEPVESASRRGASGRVYRINAQAFRGVMSELPDAVRPTLRRYAFEEFLAAAGNWLAHDGDPPEGSELEWSPAELDRLGWLELRAAHEELRRARDKAVAESLRRNRRDPKSNGLTTAISAVALLRSTG